MWSLITQRGEGGEGKQGDREEKLGNVGDIEREEKLMSQTIWSDNIVFYEKCTC